MGLVRIVYEEEDWINVWNLVESVLCYVGECFDICELFVKVYYRLDDWE